MAAGNPVRIRNRDDEEFILESADAFEREVAEHSRSEPFISFLVDRSRESGRTKLEDLDRRLAQSEQVPTDRP
jgi:hypothetical protein